MDIILAAATLHNEDVLVADRGFCCAQVSELSRHVATRTQWRRTDLDGGLAIAELLQRNAGRLLAESLANGVDQHWVRRAGEDTRRPHVVGVCYVSEWWSIEEVDSLRGGITRSGRGLEGKVFIHFMLRGSQSPSGLIKKSYE